MSQELDALIHDPEVKPLLEVNYLRHHQRVERQREIEAMDRMLQDPIAQKALQRPGELRRQNAERKKTLEAQSPPPLTPRQKAKLETLERLAPPVIQEGMPTDEEQRHYRPGDGVADRIRSWDREKKAYVLAYKRARLLLHPDSQDRDLCNIERLRPTVPTRNLYLDSPIPKVISPGLGVPEEQWNTVFDKDWRAKETQEEFTTRMASLGIEVTFTRARALRKPYHKGKVYECGHDECGGRIFSGPLAKRKYERHMAKSVEVKA